MRFLRIIALSILLLSLMTGVALADNAVLASGAGYKKMVNALTAAYAAKTGQSVDLIFGNMAQVTTQAKQGGQVDLVLGDASFLKKAELPFTATHELGRGKLVLAFPKGSAFSTIADLDRPEVTRVALPDPVKAIYGKAAREFLTATKRLPDIKPRLVEVSTIPQVFSYLVASEVDMGFMNLTHALNVKDKLGGYVVVDETQYSPILIIVGLLDGGRNTAPAQDFIAFLQSPEAVSVIRANGL